MSIENWDYATPEVIREELRSLEEKLAEAEQRAFTAETEAARLRAVVFAQARALTASEEAMIALMEGKP